MPAGRFPIPLDSPGQLFLATRPRGGDWLEVDLANWKRAGIDRIISLLTLEEERELELGIEANLVRELGLDFQNFPISDREVPEDEEAFAEFIEELHRSLQSGDRVLVHCRQGIGRAGMVAVAALTAHGETPTLAIETVSAARGRSVPETPERLRWIARFRPLDIASSQ